MDQKTYLVLTQNNAGSNHDDQIGLLYHFPRQYFAELTMPDVEFIYFEPKTAGKGEYFGYGQIGKINTDPQNIDLFCAEILNYRPFSTAVPGTDQNGHSRELGPYYNPNDSVRKTSPRREFRK